MANDTRNRILEAALTSFAEKGYEGTNLFDIAESVGIVKSAIYRHFSGKEELWNAVIDMMEAYYEEQFGIENNLPEIPSECNTLIDLTMYMADFLIHDKKIKEIRKILLMEQFRDERVNALATKHFLSGLQSIFAVIFEAMMKNGSLRKDNPQLLAFAYITPITSLMQLSDRDPKMENQVLDTIKEFSLHFIKEYGLR